MSHLIFCSNFLLLCFVIDCKFKDGHGLSRTKQGPKPISCWWTISEPGLKLAGSDGSRFLNMDWYLVIITSSALYV